MKDITFVSANAHKATRSTPYIEDIGDYKYIVALTIESLGAAVAAISGYQVELITEIMEYPFARLRRVNDNNNSVEADDVAFIKRWYPAGMRAQVAGDLTGTFRVLAATVLQINDEVNANPNHRIARIQLYFEPGNSTNYFSRFELLK